MVISHLRLRTGNASETDGLVMVMELRPWELGWVDSTTAGAASTPLWIATMAMMTRMAVAICLELTIRVGSRGREEGVVGFGGWGENIRRISFGF